MTTTPLLRDDAAPETAIRAGLRPCPGSSARFGGTRRDRAARPWKRPSKSGDRGCPAAGRRGDRPSAAPPIASLYERPSRGVSAEGGKVEVERSEEHTSELQSPCNIVCRLLLVNQK